MLQYNLDKEGYRIALAVDGDEAMLLADEETPDPAEPASPETTSA